MSNMSVTSCDIPRRLFTITGLLCKTSQKKTICLNLSLRRTLEQDILRHLTLASAIFPLKSTRMFPSAVTKCTLIPTGFEIPSTNSHLKPDQHISAQWFETLHYCNLTEFTETFLFIWSRMQMLLNWISQSQRTLLPAFQSYGLKKKALTNHKLPLSKNHIWIITLFIFCLLCAWIKTAVQRKRISWLFASLPHLTHTLSSSVPGLVCTLALYVLAFRR